MGLYKLKNRLTKMINNNDYFPGVDSSNGVLEWDECLPDCPTELVSPVCILEPIFPPFVDGTTDEVNFTSNYEYGSNVPTRDVSLNLMHNLYKSCIIILQETTQSRYRLAQW